MSLKKMPALRIGNWEADIPIVQGGMGVGISLSGLASAVANAGGIGVIATAVIGMFEPDLKTNFKEANKRALREEIQKTKAKTDGVIGVNIMVALSDYDGLIQCAVEEHVNVLFLGAGLPIRLPETLPLNKLGELPTKFVPIVSSAKAAKIIFRSWAKQFNHIPDAVVVEGPLAGGHLGFKKEQINNPDYALEKILPEVISAIKPYEKLFIKSVPVIAAGGIYTGADIHKFMQLGAQGVQMGTRFVATHECDAFQEFKDAYLNCKKEDIVIIDSPVGLPGRAIQDEFLKRVSSGVKEAFKCPWKCLRSCDFKNVPYCIALALANAKKGDLETGFAFAGANTYLVDKIISVKELIETLIEEYGYSNATVDTGQKVDIEHFRQILLKKRQEIIGNVSEIEEEALKASDGDISNMPIHMADAGTDNYEQEFALGLMDNERKLLRKIEDALERIEQETYGTCEATGALISKARLEAKPWARYCVEYARKLEQDLVTEQEQDEDGDGL